MNILLLGVAGQVGHHLAPLLSARGTVIAPTRAEADMSDLARLAEVVERARPGLIVNATAYNEVDKAESEPDAALRVNAEAVRVLGEYALREKAALVTYSTDFVFDGAKGAPYVEADAPNPVSSYGRSKLAGERMLAEVSAPALVLRTAWVYSTRRKSFVSAMLKLARERKELAIVTDQVGSPTWCGDLARATASLVDALGPDLHESATRMAGVYHAAGQGACSRYELARAALELDPKRSEHVVAKLAEAKAADFPAPARRPPYAPLDCSLLAERFGVRLLPWRDALAEALGSG